MIGIGWHSNQQQVNAEKRNSSNISVDDNYDNLMGSNEVWQKESVEVKHHHVSFFVVYPFFRLYQKSKWILDAWTT